MMKLVLVVPALNEEEAIAHTLRRVLAARASVIAQTAVTEMTAVFVNDGSTDRTQQIVDQPEFDDVVQVRFENNRGYGAAIKEGWSAVDADLLGFIDADGTCDPEVCVDLVNRIEETQADVVLAARLTPESKMPLIRRIGNMIFARLLGLVSGRELTDSASGFRIVRRSSLKYMSPLPDGLHFTPAMSAICLLDPRLKIEEVPFAYQERLGCSKLSVIKDGIRFLYVIMFAACCYSPMKTMAGLSLIGFVLSSFVAGLSWGVLGSRDAAIAMMVVWVCTTVLMFAGGTVIHQLNNLLLGPRRKLSIFERIMQRTLHHYRLIGSGLAMLVLGILGLLLVAWWGDSARGPAMAAILLCGVVAVAGAAVALGGAITRSIWSVGEKQRALLDDGYLAIEYDEYAPVGSTDARQTGEAAAAPHIHWTEGIRQKGTASRS